VTSETGRYHLAMNGEIYDYDLLLEKLLADGHQLHSHCDTEVAVHLFEDRWEGALDAIDGQFAIAAYDRAEHRLILARDRMGICPLFYAQVGDTLLFASEAKALFATGLIAPRLNPRAMDAMLGLGCVPAPWSMYEGVRAVPPGRYLEIQDGGAREKVYWDIPYPDAGDYPTRKESEWADDLFAALEYATRRRLKADVPVGMYLSGGIDSSTIASFVAEREDIRSRVFSIGFPEPGFDESAKTQRIAHALGLEAQFLTYHPEDMARDLPKLLYTCETPLVTTESIPLMALSGLASEHGKVVLTGEGSDEAMGGYRFFCWEALEQKFGPVVSKLIALTHQLQLRELNPMMPTKADRAWADNVFGFYPASMMKFRYMRRIREMVYTPDMLARANGRDDREFTSILPRDAMGSWDQLNRSLYVSSRIFMAHHLLGPHGDRALMANSVEGRYPFLDRRVQELLAQVPPKFKTKWNRDKSLLRRAMKDRLPREVIQRKKQPFLAPFGTAFVGDSTTDHIRDLLTPHMIKAYGYFDASKVALLIQAMEAHSDEHGQSDPVGFNRHTIERTIEGMALTFVVSTQLLEEMIRNGTFNTPAPV
jgi:asparagine synthase (glutamine-hydrolysing)